MVAVGNNQMGYKSSVKNLVAFVDSIYTGS